MVRRRYLTGASVAEKLRRALRNETGVSFTYEQLVWMARHGVLELIAKAEIAELLADIDDAQPEG